MKMWDTKQKNREQRRIQKNPKEIEPSDTHMSLQNNDFGAKFKAEIEAKLRAELEAEHKAKEQLWITGKHILWRKIKI